MNNGASKCHNCMEYKRGDCFGDKKGVCTDYKHSPNVSEEITKYWPKGFLGPYEYDYHESYRYLWGRY